MKWFQYNGPPDRLFYGPVTKEITTGDLLELPDDWEHHEWTPATQAQVKAWLKQPDTTASADVTATSSQTVEGDSDKETKQ